MAASAVGFPGGCRQQAHQSSALHERAMSWVVKEPTRLRPLPLNVRQADLLGKFGSFTISSLVCPQPDFPRST